MNEGPQYLSSNWFITNEHFYLTVCPHIHRIWTTLLSKCTAPVRSSEHSYAASLHLICAVVTGRSNRRIWDLELHQIAKVTATHSFPAIGEALHVWEARHCFLPKLLLLVQAVAAPKRAVHLCSSLLQALGQRQGLSWRRIGHFRSLRRSQ